VQRLEADRLQHDVDAVKRQASETEHQSEALAKEIAALQEEAYNTTSASVAQQLQVPRVGLLRMRATRFATAYFTVVFC